MHSWLQFAAAATTDDCGSLQHSGTGAISRRALASLDGVRGRAIAGAPGVSTPGLSILRRVHTTVTRPAHCQTPRQQHRPWGEGRKRTPVGTTPPAHRTSVQTRDA
eukprot:scaffold21954_cov146-Isochrysis_galbana.AAC.3